MAGATDEALWRIAVGLEERGVWQQRLPSAEEYRRVRLSPCRSCLLACVRPLTGSHPSADAPAALATARSFAAALLTDRRR